MQSMGKGARNGVDPRLGLVLALVCLFALAAPARGAFLQGALPLEPVLATPPDLLSNETKEIGVSDRVSLTVVFSRPVIALGSDFGQAALPASMVPFTLSCSVPGLTRWVTTTIYRFDPLIDWPADLDCTLKWNTALKTFDGAPLVLGAAAAQRLVTPPMTFDIISVTSKMADAVTDDQWNAYRGMKDDNFPEVPPDANVTLYFSYPVVLSALQSALKLSSCCKRSDAAGRAVRVLPCAPPFVSADPFSPAPRDPMAQNSSCAVVQVVPGLQAGQVVALQLPKGAQYNPVAGRARNTSEVYLWGLRRFRVPLRDNFQQLKGPGEKFDYADNGISYRRMSMWLPHGLAQGVKAQDLAPQISLCRYKLPYDWASPCSAAKFYLERVDKGKLLMRVPSFMPRDHYRIQVKGSKNIKDGFGLPLEASEAYFFTTEPNPDMSGPELAAGGNLIVLEPAPGSPPLKWPVVSRGKPQWDSDPAGAVSWGLDEGNYPDAVRALYDSDSVPNKLGATKSTLKRSEGMVPTMQSLTLSGAPGLQLVANTLKKGAGISGATYVSQTHLQWASVIMDTTLTAWVTDTRGVPPPPVEGAEVTLYLGTYGSPAVKGPTCKTAANGTCSVDLKPLLAGRYGSLSALVKAQGHGLLLVTSIDTPYVPSDDSGDAPRWMVEFVLDRALVQPGDTLHITGYIQQAKGTRLSLPPPSLTSATLNISPNLDKADTNQMRVPVKIDPAFGSFHVNVTVPANAEVLDHTIGLELPPPSGKGDKVSEGSESFSVKDPRPPTAVLNLTAPDWALPNATVKALIKVTSYLGADVSDATISLTWTVPLASGAINVTTDARGRAIAVIPLGALPKANATALGDQLEVKASWVGPTGEPYFEKRTVRLAEGPVRSTVARSPATDTPGIPFVVSAATFLNDEADTAVEGVTVEVSLAPANTTSLQNCSAEQRAALEKQRCTVVSGRPPVAPGGGACTIDRKSVV